MALQVFMILFFWLSVALLIGAVLCAVWLFRKKKNLTKGLLTALALLFGSVVAMRMAAAAALSPEWATEVALTTRVHVPIFHRRRLNSEMIFGE